jgi:hypothetical protein
MDSGEGFDCLRIEDVCGRANSAEGIGRMCGENPGSQFGLETNAIDYPTVRESMSLALAAFGRIEVLSIRIANISRIDTPIFILVNETAWEKRTLIECAAGIVGMVAITAPLI